MVKDVKLVGSLLFPAGPVERIDSDDLGVNDVAIGPVEMFRLERMSNGSFWSCVYAPDGSGRHVFWLYAKKGQLTVEHRWESLTG